MNRCRLLQTNVFVIAWLGLFAALATAQAPPGAETGPIAPGTGNSPSKLGTFKDLLGGSSLGGTSLGGTSLGGTSLGAGVEHVSFSAAFTFEKEKRQGILTVNAQIDPNWHIYSLTQPPGGPMKTQIRVAKSGDFVVLGGFQADRPPHLKKTKEFPVDSHEHEGTVNWSALIELSEGVEPESLQIDLKVEGTVCTDGKDGKGGQCVPFSPKVPVKFAGYTEPNATPGEYRPDESQAQLVLTGHVEPAAVKPGGKAKLTITATPNPNWHVYAYAPVDPNEVGGNKPTLIYVAPLSGWTYSPVKASAPVVTKAPIASGFPEQRYHEGEVSWTIDLNVPADSPQGEVVLSGYLGFQTCDEKSCLPPQAVQFRAGIPVRMTAQEGKIPLEFEAVERVEVDATKSLPGYSYVAKLTAENPAPTGKVDWKALLPMVGFGLLGGLILNLMPCVLPVIGLKLFSFVQQGGDSRAKIFSLNLWFVLGLLSVFLALATAAAFANLGWGQQFTYTWFKVAMIVLVFSFALSFLGVWEVPIPGFAQSTTSGKLQQKEGPAGAFFKGIFTTLLATPCSGPFLGPVFGFTLAQPPLATYIVFTSVGLGMAFPYLFIGAFPALIRWLPKPGEWMETVKQVMGFLLLGTVVFLFSTLNKVYFVPTLGLVMSVWLACWIIGRVPIYEDVNKQFRQWAVGVAVAALLGMVSFKLLGPERHLYPWQPYSPETVAKLQGDGKTVMVDFTAEWCLACKLNFKRAINTQRVKEVVEKNGIAPVLADWTEQNDAIKRQLEELDSNSIPLLAIYPANKPGEVILLRDAITQQQLLEALEKAGPSAGPGAEKHQVSSTNVQTDLQTQ
jgi:thiol:disulfide interchange protein